ncbi:MAG: hypothetical protein N3A01_04125 [Bacteroidales bacterium]|nr:hypothetical protein [Bacteroidales bacterium]
MESFIKVLMIDTSSGFYKIVRYPIGKYFGPVDIGFHLSSQYNALTIGTGLLAGSIIPGSNRLIFTGFSPCWAGFYISTMGGAALEFDNLGINMISIIGKAPQPSILYLNRNHGEEIIVDLFPVNVFDIWNTNNKGVYALLEYVFSKFGNKYQTNPRILATGPASYYTDFGAIGSAPIKNKEITHADTWAGRGGFGSKLLQQHNIAAIIYGGTYIDEDIKDKCVVDSWFEDKYNKKLIAKDIEATTKYRFDKNFETGGTFGVNYASMSSYILAFNYQSIYWTDNERIELHKKFIVDHYLKQFNEEIIKPRKFKDCGEPCVAVCKKVYQKYKKDYEPYQSLGPLIGVFDQRAAEYVTYFADSMGFDSISLGGVVAWIMECIDKGYIKPYEVGISEKPKFSPDKIKDIVEDSMHNARIAYEIIKNILTDKYEMLNLKDGARTLAHKIAYDRGKKVIDRFLYNAFRRKGWMVPNQYWTAGVLSPMPIMGKYYMNYSREFIEPRKLGRENVKRFINELYMDNMGFCRFHRNWAEEMIPEFVGKIYNKKYEYKECIKNIANWINSRNASVFWESERNIDFVSCFIQKKFNEGNINSDLEYWYNKFKEDKNKAAFDFWYEIHKGIHESLKN